jgi:hypothetical protein
MKKYSDKDLLELMLEFEESGVVNHICPDCGNECDATEVDSSKAHCYSCDEVKTFNPVI